jgi:hypothetical protein
MALESKPNFLQGIHSDVVVRGKAHCPMEHITNVVRGQQVKKLLSNHEAHQKSWRPYAPLVVKLLINKIIYPFVLVAL